MTLVIDASVVGAALTDHTADGNWAEGLLSSHSLAAPHFMPVEVVHLLRRGALSGWLSEDLASQAQEEVLRLPVVLFPYEPFAARVWQLRHNVTPYDAWYVAMAEDLGAPLATLDSRLVAASGPTCTFVRAPPR